MYYIGYVRWLAASSLLDDSWYMYLYYFIFYICFFMYYIGYFMYYIGAPPDAHPSLLFFSSFFFEACPLV